MPQSASRGGGEVGGALSPRGVLSSGDVLSPRRRGLVWGVSGLGGVCLALGESGLGGV